MDTVFALVDCNNFYASCEGVFDPRLVKLPVVVLSNNDGCIIARSNQAKSAGIRMGEPFFEQQDLIDRHNIQVFSANFALYGDMSNRVMETLKQFSPQMEIYSIDEAFLTLSGTSGDPESCAREIRRTVRQWTGIPVTVGLGPTKTLAKAANKFAKRMPGANGVLNLCHNPRLDGYLEQLEVKDIWGVGLRYAKLLNCQGVHNAWQLIHRSDAWIKNNMTVTGLRTVTELRGTPCIRLEHFARPKKAVLTSRSFGQLIRDRAQLSQAVAEFTAASAEKARRQRSAAAFVQVFIETSGFRQEPQYRAFMTVGLPSATGHTPDLIKYAGRALEKIFKPGYNYKRAGVMLSGLVPDSQVQLDLESDQEKHRQKQAVMQAVDKINLSQGRNTVFYAAQGVAKPWKMRQLTLSPRYTTSWADLPVAKA
ncbi:MAG: Y-family DNA polymerase [Candidatus Edwardsbacteria bacterium]|nr:Y-family DNA polymerase [Candidatus Edwardsbacteria bacterium]